MDNKLMFNYRKFRKYSGKMLKRMLDNTSIEFLVSKADKDHLVFKMLILKLLADKRKFKKLYRKRLNLNTSKYYDIIAYTFKYYSTRKSIKNIGLQLINFYGLYSKNVEYIPTESECMLCEKIIGNYMSAQYMHEI